MSLSAKWTTANAAYFVNINPVGVLSTTGCIMARALVANLRYSNAGIVPLDASGQFKIEVGGAAADVYIDAWGYIL